MKFLNDDELKKITNLFENMTSSIVKLTEKTEEQDRKIRHLENQIIRSLDLNADAIETVTNRFQTPFEDLRIRINELESLIASSTQTFSLLKESDITFRLQRLDIMFELLVDLSLINLRILSIFMEFNNRIIEGSLDEEFMYSKNNQLQKELLEYNKIYGDFIEQTRQD